MTILNETADDRQFRGTAARSSTAPPLDRHEPIPYVDDKPVDLGHVGELLELSRRAHQWSNFGPVSLRLEETIAEHLALPVDRAVVATSSGSAALVALVSLHDHLVGRRLRWVVSAFGFPATRQGPLADATVVDCDRDGMLSTRELSALDPTTYDGFVATNVFGLASDLSDHVEFARAHGKVLICDGALAFDGAHRSAGRTPPYELISFHHTKPWGMGEAGCVILPSDQVRTFRSVINAGRVRGEPTAGNSMNGKLSDLAAAFVLQRLRDLPSDAPRYHHQFERVIRLARPLGFEALGPPSRAPDGARATPACASLLAPHPVAEDHLRNPHVVLRKYYRPLTRGCATAWDLYRRIVNVPTHPGLEQLSDDELRGCLQGVLDHARRGRPRWCGSR